MVGGGGVVVERVVKARALLHVPVVRVGVMEMA